MASHDDYQWNKAIGGSTYAGFQQIAADAKARSVIAPVKTPKASSPSNTLINSPSPTTFGSRAYSTGSQKYKLGISIVDLLIATIFMGPVAFLVIASVLESYEYQETTIHNKYTFIASCFIAAIISYFYMRYEYDIWRIIRYILKIIFYLAIGFVAIMFAFSFLN